MDVIILAVFCLVCGSSIASKEPKYVHRFLSDGDKVEPEVNFLSQKYTKDQRRRWSLYADEGVWALVFLRFSLEYSTNCEHDYLQVEEINNGSQHEPIRPVRYCGWHMPKPYVSTRSMVDIYFVSDDIWEMSGFLVQVIHSKDPAALKEKMRPFVEIAEKQQQDGPSDNSPKKDDDVVSAQHPLFFTLIGCSIASLVVFGILLTYFIMSISNKEKTLPIQAPDSFYIRPSACVTENRKPGIIVPKTGSRSVDCNVIKTGKRYSKDNTARKAIVFKKTSAHHNNLYVSNNLSSNG